MPPLPVSISTRLQTREMSDVNEHMIEGWKDGPSWLIKFSARLVSQTLHSMS